MATNTFDSHLSEIGKQLAALRSTINDLQGLLKRHDHNDYTSLITADYTDRLVTKVQYDAALTSINDLINVWLASGHGTNIDGYLYEVP